MELPTPYNIFWRELRNVLMVAGASAEQYLAAVSRLKRIEGEPTGPGTGQTGYLNGVEPYGALRDYAAHVTHGAPVPFWLMSAERGF